MVNKGNNRVMISSKLVYVGKDSLKGEENLVYEVDKFPLQYVIMINCRNRYKIDKNELVFDEEYIQEKVNLLNGYKIEIDKMYCLLVINNHSRTFYDFGRNKINNYIMDICEKTKGRFITVEEWVIKEILE